MLSACWKVEQTSSKNIEQVKKEIIKNDKDIQEIQKVQDTLLEDDINEENYDLWNTNGLDTWDNQVEDTNSSKGKKRIKYKKLSDFDISSFQSSRLCLMLHISIKDKKKCLNILDGKIMDWFLTLKTCKRLYFTKNRKQCLDKVYLWLAQKRKKISYCSFIKDNNIKNVCKKDITHYLYEVKKQELEQKKLRNKKEEIKKINDISFCDSHKGNDLYNCINSLVWKKNNLTLCDKLSWVDKNKCINNNWNTVLKYNLLQAVKTKDVSYCDKIWNNEWINRCKSKIK